MKIIFAFLLLLSSLFCSAQYNSIKIAFMGDSYCNGCCVAVVGNERPEAYRYLLRQRFAQYYTTVTEVKLCLGGEDIRDAMPNWYPGNIPTRNIDAALSNNPDFIILEYAGNHFADLHSLDTIKWCYQYIADTLNSLGKKFLFTSAMPRQTSFDPPMTYSDYQDSAMLFNTWLLATFPNNSVDCFTNLYNPATDKPIANLLGSDSLHWNAAGYQIIADDIFEQAAVIDSLCGFEKIRLFNMRMVLNQADDSVDITADVIRAKELEIKSSDDGITFNTEYSGEYVVELPRIKNHPYIQVRAIQNESKIITVTKQIETMAAITSTPLSFATRMILPGAGPDQWHNGSEGIGYPTDTTVHRSLDWYVRFYWTQIETGTQGVYNWTYFDNLLKEAIDSARKFSFGIMMFNPDGGPVSYDGGTSAYPEYLHTLMQSETANSRDYLQNGVWIPNWNSTNVHNRLNALHTAIRNRLLTQSHTPSAGPNQGKTVLFGDAVFAIDIRGFGSWGEWHTGGIGDFAAMPTGRVPTTAGLKAIIDAHKVFDKWPLQAMVAGFAGNSSPISLFIKNSEVAHYLLTTTNTWGQFGWRRDQWFATDGYLLALLENNNDTYNGSAQFKTIILNKYKFAPVTGEPPSWNPEEFYDAVRQVNLYHPATIGNGNFGYPASQPPLLTTRDTIRAAFAACGYKWTVTTGTFSNTTTSLALTLNWNNGGIAPTYENWKVVVGLKSGSTVVWTDTSSFKHFLKLGAHSVSENFNISTVGAGTYTLYIKVVDSLGFRDPMPLYLSNRQADGSYNLGSITVNAIANIGPSVSAGSDLVITLPVNSVTLTGSATDPDGTISSRTWRKVSGSGSVQTPSGSNTTLVLGLTQGDSIFEFAATDNLGASATDQVKVTTLAAVVPPPTNPTITKSQLISRNTFSDGSIQEKIVTV